MTDDTTTARAGRREWTGLGVLALPTVLLALDLTVLHLAVPGLSADLQPTGSQLLWIVDIYGFLIAGFLVTMGALGDRTGRRRLLLYGAAAFGAASVLAAFSTSAGMLIATRALLGIAGATLMPATLSLIRTMFRDQAERRTAIAVWITSFMVGSAIGPVVGGVLLEHFWWGSVFLLGVPVMVLLLVAGPLLLPEYRAPDPQPLDPLSVLFSVAAMLSLVYGIKELARYGPGWEPGLFLGAGLVAGAAFLHRQRTVANPLIDLRLFAHRSFSAALVTVGLAIFAISGTMFFIGQYLQLVLGLSPLQAGLWLLPQAGAVIAGSMAAPFLVRRLRPAYVMTAGMTVASGGLLLITRVDGVGGLGALVAGSVLLAAGFGPAMTLGTDLVVGTAPPEKAGAASAISETGTELGAALGIAVIGSVGTAVYRREVSDGLPGVPAEVTAAASDTLGGAVVAAARLPEAVAAELLHGARLAFAHGMQLTAGIGSVLVLALAAFAGVLLRHIRHDGGEQPAEGAPVPDGEPVEAAGSGQGRG